jgi:hypothetical protein
MYTVEILTPDGVWVKLNDETFTLEVAIRRYGTWLREPDSPVRLAPCKG